MERHGLDIITIKRVECTHGKGGIFYFLGEVTHYDGKEAHGHFLLQNKEMTGVFTVTEKIFKNDYTLIS